MEVVIIEENDEMTRRSNYHDNNITDSRNILGSISVEINRPNHSGPYIALGSTACKPYIVKSG
jgi:hypothetical protein